MTSHDITQQTQLSHFINKPPSSDWAHLSSAVTKETASICDRIQSLTNEVCAASVVIVTAVMTPNV